MSPDLTALAMFGSRFVLFLTVIVGLIWALRPTDWNSIDYEPIAFSFLAFLGWIGLEINQYYANYRPAEHPSDIKLARSILSAIHLNDLYFFENHDFGGSFSYEKLDGINYLYGFTLVERKYFHSKILESKLKEVTNTCAELLVKIGERGGHLRSGPSYVIMSDEEFITHKRGQDVSDETEKRICDVNNLSSEFASKFKELHQLLLDFLPSAYEEDRKDESKQKI